ncbi:MAG TPA: protein-glutamine glutaminase family protein [Methanothrix sp.]|jgi:hypothetical protein|uniref:protein-glutamine glutaminase family protein n=1 Tax=Methanothrix sp. TaxID=90426 RepID=UPI002BA0B493|nr:protein-glutamine glutaminase family protein [Methanothrix sp.]MDI9417304.1 protein-glutamine glutaminase family protein [Euryarchaeota archaeon]HON35947.1 protein-glutamine glutaminase family protein [Methanothrix sp.]HRU75255.1 protein-glutamine glutaminase family protein [Methanothrix sp.]
MAKPNVIVDTVRGLSSPTEAVAAVPGKRRARVIEINFEGGKSGFLELKDRRSAAWADVIDDMRQSNQSVYVEIDPQTNVITEVLVPLAVKVGGMKPLEDGDVEVELLISQAKHYLRRSNPDFQDLSEALKRSMDEIKDVLITEAPNTHDIIDVRTNPKPLALVEAAAPPSSSIAPMLATITPQKAQELFDLVKSKTCCPASAASPCIPFLYPDDGCWGRAHEMYRLMIAMGVSPDKVWIYGSLKTPTTNNPNCIVYWGWHVAPIVQVSGSGIQVIDPSLFNGPVTEAAWKGVQGDPSAVLVHTSGSVFHRSYSGSVTYDDAAYTRTNQVLSTYRNHLKIRSVSSSGPPPYINCLSRPAGVQWFGTIGPNATSKWYTWGWPAALHLFWTIMPITHCPGKPQLTWTVEVERANATQCTYWITVRNLTGDPVRFEGRYNVLK